MCVSSMKHEKSIDRILCKQVRSGTATNSFMMVDSPGMIDSPMSRSIYDRSSPNDDSTGRRRGSDTSRGYDFEGVVRWFAERADVILLFFDPDKPGTTGETLSILTNSLPGMDHKLYIVLNKVRWPAMRSRFRACVDARHSCS